MNKCINCNNPTKNNKFCNIKCRDVYWKNTDYFKINRLNCKVCGCYISKHNPHKIEDCKKHIEKIKIANTGKKRSEESRLKYGKTSSERMKLDKYRKIALENINNWNKRNNNGKGKNNPNYGKGCHRSKRYKYKNIMFRSTWEAFFAKFLDKFNLTWKYEPKRFEFKLLDKTYLPDFFVEEWNCYVEIKGRYTQDCINKIDCFYQEYPDENLIVIDDWETIKQIKQ